MEHKETETLFARDASLRRACARRAVRHRPTADASRRMAACVMRRVQAEQARSERRETLLMWTLGACAVAGGIVAMVVYCGPQMRDMGSLVVQSFSVLTLPLSLVTLAVCACFAVLNRLFRRWILG